LGFKASGQLGSCAPHGADGDEFALEKWDPASCEGPYPQIDGWGDPRSAR
jgi:hypothetical protein